VQKKTFLGSIKLLKLSDGAVAVQQSDILTCMILHNAHDMQVLVVVPKSVAVRCRDEFHRKTTFIVSNSFN